MNVRLEGAITAVRDAIAAAAVVPVESVGVDEDLIDDLSMDAIELESLGLILEDIFSVMVPDGLWRTPLYRTASSIADWCIRHSDTAAWTEARQQRKRA